MSDPNSPTAPPPPPPPPTMKDPRPFLFMPQSPRSRQCFVKHIAALTSRRYGTIPLDIIRIEEEAHSVVRAIPFTENNRFEIVNLYLREIANRINDSVRKARATAAAASGSDAASSTSASGPVKRGLMLVALFLVLVLLGLQGRKSH